MAYNHILFPSRNKTKRFNQSSASPKGALCPFTDMLIGENSYSYLKARRDKMCYIINH